MAVLEWAVVKNMVDVNGSFTHQIKWNAPADSGFIVQYVEVIDPLKTIRNYTKPYYEAWKVENGTVIHEGNGDEQYDDSFTNEQNGSYLICKQFAIDAVQNAMKKEKVSTMSISYNCKVFWVDKDDCAYSIINNWEKGDDCGITMAGQLRASYIAPGSIGEGISRIFKADFVLQDSTQE